MTATPRELLAGLNPEQAAAVSHGEGPLLVLAGAGSGKTRVLTRRLAWLLAHGAAPPSVVALTFTNKAAGEMRERVEQLVGGARGSFVGTFHAWCVRLLRRFHAEAGLPKGFVVFDADDQLAVVKQALKEAGVTDKALTPKSVLSRISRAKNESLRPEEALLRASDPTGERLASLFGRYEKGLRAAGAVDFDDLLLLTDRLLASREDVLSLLRRSVAHLLVDEYQDTNRVQARLVSRVAGSRADVFAVGDEDQSIYRWRGADVSNILEFTRAFPGARTVRLERNYRSTQPILSAAGAVVAENRRRLGKTLRAEKAGGEKVRLLLVDEERDEAREVVSRIAAARRRRPEGDVAVLFRTNAQSRPFEDELVRARLPYLLVGGTRFYERAEVKDALAYLRLCANPDDDVSFRRVVNVPARGVGAATLEALAAASAARGVSLFRVLEEAPGTLGERARKALAQFRALVEGLAARAQREDASAAELVSAALDETGLFDLYASSDDPQDASRRENLDQLRAAAREHERSTEGDPSLAGFLDAVTLRSDADDVDERRGVLLLTLHAAKGLEFDEVFLVGVEDGSLPHASSREDDDAVEEERRLMYVGMTRARDRLTLSLARRRMVRGEWSTREPSPFLSALPAGSVAWEDLSAGSYRLAAAGAAPSRDGGLFPDYEGESQETPPPGRRPAGRAAPPRFAPMRRTAPPPSASGFRRGSRVKHPEYGAGVVLALEGSGDAEKVTVYFERAGKRKFVARFANLSPG